eukprot:TRINITY_DN60853_c0_g1_i1.p1 TRINITY_DN60853_c0_g1~~TRINITY_DN60853_c0_g1_i1.p1  ORF type:complete len:718 (+),score=97.71 TRINITY_DN60853_c0_g1_i1:103-2256(+)
MRYYAPGSHDSRRRRGMQPLARWSPNMEARGLCSAPAVLFISLSGGFFSQSRAVAARTIPCSAPAVLGAASPLPCLEGSDIADGAICTPNCDAGFAPLTPNPLVCSSGVLEPPDFICSPSPCPLPLCLNCGNYSNLACTGQVNSTHVSSGNVCAPQCGEGETPSATSLRCTGGRFSPPSFTCNPTSCAVPTDVIHTSRHPCVGIPTEGTRRTTRLLFLGRGSSDRHSNVWGGWYSRGRSVQSGNGKRSFYDHGEIVGVRFEDSAGSFAEYILLDEFTRRPLLEIVQECMSGAIANDGSEEWNSGHCHVGELIDSSGISDISSLLRIGVGDGTNDANDWALFMLKEGNANGDFSGHDEYAFASEEETNTGWGGEVSIHGVLTEPPGLVRHGEVCTTRCDGLFMPTEKSLVCHHGALSPASFQCHAPSCALPVVEHAAAPPCVEGGSAEFSHGSICTPRCEYPLYLPTGAERLVCHFGTWRPPTFTCRHACDGAVPGLMASTDREHPHQRRSYTGPALWGTGLDLGPASLNDMSLAAAEFRAGVAPENWRFSKLGRDGPPHPASRRLADELASGFACRVCQLLVNALLKEVQSMSATRSEKWLAEGCGSLVRRLLLHVGWQLTTYDCGGAGIRLLEAGGAWCLRQDHHGEVIRNPELQNEYDPARDAFHRICERTVQANAPRVAAFLEVERNGTPSNARNEHLAQMACTKAACCTGLQP